MSDRKIADEDSSARAAWIAANSGCVALVEPKEPVVVSVEDWPLNPEVAH